MFGCEPQIDDRWIELDYGDYDGMALGLVPAEVWEGWRSDSEYTSPGGESMGSLERRVRAACDDVLAVAVTETVVVVSHVTPIKAAVAWALGGDSSMTSRCHLDHAGVCRIQAGARSPILRSFNEVLYDRSRASE